VSVSSTSTSSTPSSGASAVVTAGPALVLPSAGELAARDNRAAIGPDVPTRGRIAILTADRVEDVEFFYPYYRFVEEGYTVDVITPSGGALTGYKGMGLKETTALDQVDPADYDLLFIPGGLAPGELRRDPRALAFVQAVAGRGTTIGAVCHGPQVLVDAGLVAGRSMTSWHEVAPEITAAGGTYLDRALVEDGQFVTSRKPGDMPLEISRLLQRLTAATPA
jgi:protease I